MCGNHSRQVSRGTSHRAGRVCGRADACIQRQHTRTRSRSATVAKRYAPRGRLDCGAINHRQRHRDRCVADGRQGAKLGQHHRDASSLYAHLGIVSELARHERQRRASDSTVNTYRHLFGDSDNARFYQKDGDTVSPTQGLCRQGADCRPSDI